MFKPHLSEIVLSVAVVFMGATRSLTGVLAFALALAFVAGLKVLEQIERKESPDVSRINAEIADLKSKIDKIILGRGR